MHGQNVDRGGDVVVRVCMESFLTLQFSYERGIGYVRRAVGSL